MLKKVLAPVLAVALLLMVGGLVIFSVRSSSGDEPAADAPDRSNCVEVHVVASSEKASLLGVLAEQYNATNPTLPSPAGASASPSASSKCVAVSVRSKASGDAQQALTVGWNEQADGQYPTVWSPASSLWLKLLEKRLTDADKPQVVAPDAQSIVKTPVVFAMPRPMAEALGWPGKAIGWDTLSTLATDPRGWAAYGHPEWGAFTLGKTHPELSTSGLAGTIGEFYAATGLTSDLKVSDVTSPETAAKVTDIEQSVTHYGDTTLTFLANQASVDAVSSIPYVSAVVVEEKSVFDYNTGNPTGKAELVGQGALPRVPLVAIQPKEGTLYSDNPYGIITAPWVSPEQAAAAEGFFEFLQLPSSQEAFTAAGFRSADEQLSAALQADPNFTAAPPSNVLTPPSGEIIDAVQSQWKDLRKKARIMIVMDVSGSMDDDAGDGQTKLEKASAAVRNSLSEFSPEDQVGFAIFTSDLEGGQDNIYKVLVPVAPMSTNEALISSALQLMPMNGTPLYNTIALSQAEARAALDPDLINAVVILTDGKNSADNSISLDTLLATIATDNENRATNIKVFTIGYGQDADMDVLRQISSATGAAAYDATNPANIEKVLTSVVSNF